MANVPISITFDRVKREFKVDPSTVKIQVNDEVTWSIIPDSDKFAVDFPDGSPFGDYSYFSHKDATTPPASEKGRFGYIVAVGLVENSQVTQLKSASGPEIIVVA